MQDVFFQSKVIDIFRKLRWRPSLVIKLVIRLDHPRRRTEVIVCVPGGLRCVKFLSFIKIGLVVLPLWVVENRPSPLLWPLAYTTACTTVQAVITRFCMASSSCFCAFVRA